MKAIPARLDYSDNCEDIPPLLKWAGGKRLLLKNLVPLFPARFNNYFEPFVGGGAVFFALRPSNAVLSDKNPDLINCYRQVRDHPQEVLEALSRMTNSAVDYYRIRKERPKSRVERAAQIVYLTTLSFNGIYRQNLQGQFNVPYGYKTHLQPCNADLINLASKALQGIELRCSDFRTILKRPEAGDAVYLDPPYTVAHSNNGFVKYNAKIFSWRDQVKLAQMAQTLADRGCTVVVSNAFHSSIQELYPKFIHIPVQRSSVIAASKKFRGSFTESIFYNEVV